MIDNTKEYILCSAIKRNEKFFNYNRSFDFELGRRHHDILLRFEGELSKSPAAQGFLTSKDRVVDREVAAKIAYECGQIQEWHEGKELYSEDLY
jgi:hypothetical protein